MINRWRSSTNFARIPSAFHWYLFSLFREATGRGWEGVEFVGLESWQLVDVARWFCLSLVHVSHFHWSSRVKAFRPVLHFLSKPFLHTLHLTGTMLERRAAKHLAHFSLEFLASARDMPWFKSEFNDGGVRRSEEVSGWVDEYPLAVGEECNWQCQTWKVGVWTRRCCILLNPSINFRRAYGAKHWVLIDWSPD